jgi:Tol biopolymer transport system component
MRDLIGRTLGHYRIVDKIGEGGMGEVYRACDERLDRDVAIKVLPEAVAQDSDRLARFEREAKLLASLSHQNIATLYGLEEHEGRRFLVMELAEGETLAERLKKGPIPVDDALPVALQIAEGLEAAHEVGIIHRDLKPANVMVSPEGRVKVLDFGLAKAWQPEGSDVDITHSPTLTGQMTAAGILLGTAAYMSPEQARGKPVDRRADVWSFGVLLWEMLTGRSLFAGETVTDVIAAVVTKDVDLDVLPAHTPRTIRRLLSRCLRRDPLTRLPDIGSARLELQDVIAGAAMEQEPNAADIGDATRTERRRRVRERWAWAAFALVLAGLATFPMLQRLNKPPEARPVAHFVLDMPEDVAFGDPNYFDPPAVSPDGRSIVITGRLPDGTVQLWARSLDEPEFRVLPGTDGAEFPFWSPDGTSVAFSAEGELKKLILASGTVQRICVLPRRLGFGGGTWNIGGTIVFSTGGTGSSLYSVPAAGGEAKPLTSLDMTRGKTALFDPQFLPDGRHVIFTDYSEEEEQAGLHVTSLEAPDERRRILPDQARFLYADPGYLLFVREGILVAQPFDAKLQVTNGEALPIASAVEEWNLAPGSGLFSVSETGLLTWSSAKDREVRLEWLDRTGERIGTLGEPGRYGQIVLSPDDARVAVEVADNAGRFDIWVIDVARGVASRLTSDPGDERDPVWSPDGQELVFCTATGGGDLVRKALAAGTSASPLVQSAQPHVPESWSHDGNTLLYLTDGEGGERILSALFLGGEGPAERLMTSSFYFDETQVSPDGQWLAFISTESGRAEVYVEPFRRRGERVRVSANGGGQPKWRGDSKELFYLTVDGALIAVNVREGTTGPIIGLPTTLVPADVLSAVVQGPEFDDYAVSADGQRILVKRPATKDERQRIHVLLNWPSLLEKNEGGR